MAIPGTEHSFEIYPQNIVSDFGFINNIPFIEQVLLDFKQQTRTYMKSSMTQSDTQRYCYNACEDSIPYPSSRDRLWPLKYKL